MKTILIFVYTLLLMPLAASHADEEYPVGFSTHGSWGGSGLSGADPEVLSVRGTRPDDYVVWKPDLKGSAHVRVAVYGIIEAGITNKQHYEVHHQGKVSVVDLNITGQSGWFTLGIFQFNGDGREFLKLVKGEATSMRAAEAKFGILSEDGRCVTHTLVVPQGKPRIRVTQRRLAAGSLSDQAVAPGIVEPVKALWLPPHLSDGMVIQRRAKIVVAGRAPLGAEVSVSLAGNSCTTSGGEFKVVLPALEAGGPYELKVRCDNEEKIVHDAMVGDVWVLSGQSNMGFGVGGLDDKTDVLADATYPAIRYFKAESGSWISSDPKNVVLFSAVGYLLGRALHKYLKIPIGLVYLPPVGGDIRGYIRDEELAKLDSKIPFVPGLPNRRSVLSHEFRPLVACPITGFLYYQGEGNSPAPVSYRDLLPALARDVRNLWGQGDFPFIYIQLPRYTIDFVGLRESQRLAQAEIPNSAMVISIDTGVEGLVHPGDKRQIGERTVAAALALAYGVQGEYTGPMFAGATIHGHSLFVHFTHCGKGLIHQGTLEGFELCGDDGDFKPAKAEIVGADKVRIWRDDVVVPQMARYLWSGAPGLTPLRNREGFPASPFCTHSDKADQVLDNGDLGFSVRGDWRLQSQKNGFGPGFVFDVTRETDGECDWVPWVKWRLGVIQSGEYAIYLRWPNGRPVTATAEVEIIGNGEIYPRIPLSQAGTDGNWHRLGTYRLDYGDNNSVKIITRGADVAIDALKIVFEQK